MKKRKSDKVVVIDGQEMIDKILDILTEGDGEFIAKVANDVLGKDKKVRFTEDGMFEIIIHS